MSDSLGSTQDETLHALAEQLRALEGRKTAPQEMVSSGHAGLDAFLPEGGFRRGILVEWLAAERGGGAGSLALSAARAAAAAGGALVVVDTPGRFYPPAVITLGIDPGQLILVRPANVAEEAWALDQILRSPGVAAVCAWPGEHEEHTQRRWQLAAESSGVLGLLLRGESARHAPSWAELRLLVTPIVAPHSSSRRRCLRIELLRQRSGRAGSVVELEFSLADGHPEKQPDVNPAQPGRQARTKPVASPVAAAKNHRRSRRA